MRIMRQVKVFADVSGVTQEMGEDELQHISWWGDSVVGKWKGWEGEGCNNVGQGVNEVCMRKYY